MRADSVTQEIDFGVQGVISECSRIFESLDAMDIDTRADAINQIRLALRQHSPFQGEPVDCVLWVRSGSVIANDYNPNSVAPPEMKLLEHSIDKDGYTQPIVSWQNDSSFEVVDGFHRHRVGKESVSVQKRTHGFLPIVLINESSANKGDRMAATIRHNRARGEHRVESMSDIVIELKRRFWSDEKIAKELGMEADEVLRLTQITGLAGLFADREFSEAWEAESFNEIEGNNIQE